MLTELAIRAFKPRQTLYRVADAHGLALEITPKGAKHWRYRYRRAGKAQMISLGTYPVVSLAEARERLLEARRQLANGQDPAQVKREAKKAIHEQEKGRFPVFAAAWLREREDNVKPKTYAKTETIVTKDLIPSLRHTNIATLTTPEAVQALDKIAQRSPHMAIKALGYLNDMIDQAIKTGLREDGRTLSIRGAVKLPRAKSVPAATDPASLKRVLLAIDNHKNPIVQAALKLTALTALRPQNVVEARWSEIDLEKKTWTKPAELMKTGEEHTIPLPRQAVALLQELRDLAGEQQWVFPAQARQQTQHLHRDTLSNALRAAGLQDVHVPHGFRAAFRTIAREEFGVDIDVLEAQLAHSRGNATERAYNRSRHLRRRHKVMQRWADYLDKVRSDNATVAKTLYAKPAQRLSEIRTSEKSPTASIACGNPA